MENVWEEVKKIINKNTDISVEILELLSVNEILSQCVSGLSVSHIARYIDQDEKYVREVTLEFIGFEGWNEDLDFSPIVCYNRSNSIEEFKEDIKSFSYVPKTYGFIFIYDLCKRYKKLEERIKNGDTRF
jgi:hypothetical protein